MPPESEQAVNMSYWQNLANAADTGHLFLDEDTARECDRICVTYLEKLDKHRAAAYLLGKVDGFGDFDSGKQFAQILSDKAIDGPNSMVGVIDSHIRVVKEMQVVFRKFFTQYSATDADNASEISEQYPN